MMNEGGIEQPGVAKEPEVTDYRHVDPLLGREGDVMDTTASPHTHPDGAAPSPYLLQRDMHRDCTYRHTPLARPDPAGT